MREDDFKARLAQLRGRKGVSARDMSLSIGQNAGYINNIENGKALPSMSTFFYICDYLGISPQEFFDEGSSNPAQLKSVFEDLKCLNNEQLSSIANIVHDLKKGNSFQH